MLVSGLAAVNYLAINSTGPDLWHEKSPKKRTTPQARRGSTGDSSYGLYKRKSISMGGHYRHSWGIFEWGGGGQQFFSTNTQFCLPKKNPLLYPIPHTPLYHAFVSHTVMQLLTLGKKYIIIKKMAENRQT